MSKRLFISAHTKQILILAVVCAVAFCHIPLQREVPCAVCRELRWWAEEYVFPATEFRTGTLIANDENSVKIVKIVEDGAVAWAREYYLKAIVQKAHCHGSFFAATNYSTTAEIILVKTAPDGAVESAVKYSYSRDIFINGIFSTETRIFLAGTIREMYGTAGFLAATDVEGNFQWARKFYVENASIELLQVYASDYVYTGGFITHNQTCAIAAALDFSGNVHYAKILESDQNVIITAVSENCFAGRIHDNPAVIMFVDGTVNITTIFDYYGCVRDIYRNGDEYFAVFANACVRISENGIALQQWESNLPIRNILLEGNYIKMFLQNDTKTIICKTDGNMRIVFDTDDICFLPGEVHQFAKRLSAENFTGIYPIILTTGECSISVENIDVIHTRVASPYHAPHLAIENVFRTQDTVIVVVDVYDPDGDAIVLNGVMVAGSTVITGTEIAPFTICFSIAGERGGVYEIRIYAYDSYNFTVVFSHITINYPPQIDTINATTGTNMIFLSWTAHDTDYGDYLTYTVSILQNERVVLQISTNYTFLEIPTSLLPRGYYSVKITAKDRHNATAEKTAASAIIIENRPPKVIVSVQTDGAEIQIRYNASDDDHDFLTIKIRILHEAVEVHKHTSYLTQAVYTYKALHGGEYLIIVEVSDSFETTVFSTALQIEVPLEFAVILQIAGISAAIAAAAAIIRYKRRIYNKDFKK